MPQKKITICASVSLNSAINRWKEKLKQDGYTIIQYPKQLTGEFLPNYAKEFTKHYQKISESDIVLALNMQKNGIKGYIGAGVFAEIAFVIGLNRTSHLNKKIYIYCLNPFPNSLPYSEELNYWVKLGWLKFWR